MEKISASASQPHPVEGGAGLVNQPTARALPDRSGQMFPRLTPAQIARVASLGNRREVQAGQVLFDVGEQNTQLYVVLEGEVRIVRPIGEQEELVVVHGAGQFTGEINMLSARRSLVRARVVTGGSVIAVDRDHLPGLIQRDSELSRSCCGPSF